MIPRTPAERLLKQYYAEITPLRAYLERLVLCAEGNQLLREGDGQAYRQLLEETLVATAVEEAKEMPLRAMTASQGAQDMSEVVTRALHAIFFGSNANRANVLAQGYQDASRSDSRAPASHGGLVAVYTNTQVTLLQTSPEWQILLDRIGSTAMIRLISQTSLFCALPNDCYVQLSGVKLLDLWDKKSSYLKINFSTPPTESRANLQQSLAVRRTAGSLKRAASSAEALPIAKKRKITLLEVKKPNDIIFVRAKILHATTTYNPETRQTAVGLSPYHLFNKINSLELSSDRFAKERQMLKHIFPRAFGLQNPFEITRDTPKGFYNTRFDEREDEIKNFGAMKTPRRLRGAARKMIAQVLGSHEKYDYKLALNKTCPSRLKHTKLTKAEKSAIYELITAEPKATNSVDQLAPSVDLNFSFLASGRPPIRHSLKPKEVPKPRFAEFAISHGEVGMFVQRSVQACFPLAVWGSQHNMDRAIAVCEEVTRYKRYESASLHTLSQGFRLGDFAMFQYDDQKSARTSLAERKAREEYFQEFLYWFTDQWLFDLLATTFYITETSALGHRCLYFRRDDWRVLCEPLVEEMSSRIFTVLPEQEASSWMQDRTLGFSTVRLVPKEAGVRPIVNLSRKNIEEPSSGRYKRSINDILSDTFAILKYEATAHPELLGASATSWTSIYDSLRTFQQKQAKMCNPVGLYFVKVDVRACFDTIDQDKMIDLLLSIISHDAYSVQKSQARPSAETSVFLELARALSAELKHVIFTDRVRHNSVDKDKLLELLDEHVKDNIVKISGLLYRQTSGIPQGSVLSTLLCNFFYADLEKNKLAFAERDDSILLRQTDDFLYITASSKSAAKFLHSMHRGHPEYGCYISAAKTMTNFPAPTVSKLCPSGAGFPYCGLLIDQQTLAVRVDYSRQANLPISETLNIERSRSPGLYMRHKMYQYIKVRSHNIFTDASLNTPHTVLLNCYQNALLTAMRFVSYIAIWKPDLQRSQAMFKNIVNETILMAFTATMARQKAVSHHAVIWLARKAFQLVLSRRPTKFDFLLKMLSHRLRKSRRVYLDRRVHRVLKDSSNAAVLALQY